MKNDLYEQGPEMLCFDLLEKIYGHNKEEEFIRSGSKAKTNLGVAGRLPVGKKSILLESSFV
jgi:hypothetical protein